ncbi:hypothetical protein VZO05_15925 (plasmid) [Aggregatilineales bacterium SYSU G02658]
MLRVSLHIGETLGLMPTRTVYWERTRTLLAAELRLTGAPADAAALERLQRAVDDTQPRRIIMLGSWFEKRCERLPTLLLEWAAQGHKLHQVGGQVNSLGELANIAYTGGPTPGPHFVLSAQPIQPVEGFALAPHNRPALLAGQLVPCFVFESALGLLPYLCDAPFDDPPYPALFDEAAIYPITDRVVDLNQTPR